MKIFVNSLKIRLICRANISIQSGFEQKKKMKRKKAKMAMFKVRCLSSRHFIYLYYFCLVQVKLSVIQF